MMTLRDEIMKAHSKEHTATVAAIACGSKQVFSSLVECFDSEDKVLAQRAAWALSHASVQRPDLVKPHLARIVSALDRKDVHDAVHRNALKILEEIPIPRPLHGRVMNSCFRYVENPGAAPALKAYSLTILHKLSVSYPDIMAELKLLIEEQWEHESPAFRARARPILKAIGSVKHP